MPSRGGIKKHPHVDGDLACSRSYQKFTFYPDLLSFPLNVNYVHTPVCIMGLGLMLFNATSNNISAI